MLGICRVDQHESYLGLPVAISHSKHVAFQFLTDRMKKKLSSWKHKHLSSGGREVMIKSVLQAIPSYVMCCFEIPKQSCDEMHSILANFWWGQEMGKRKIHWIAWEKLCNSKVEGGMGFHNMRDFNLALLAKQGWRILLNPDSLLSRILKAKYFPHSSFLEAELRGGESYTWRRILAGRALLESGLRVKIGSGESTSVWRDKWLPIPYGFKVFSFPDTGTEELKVSELMLHDQKMWNNNLLQELFTEEETMAIASIPLSWESRRDTLIWHSTKDGKYTVRSGYWWWREYKNCEHRCSSSSASGGIGQSWNQIWNLPMPPKIRIFIWRPLLESIPTKTTLCRRHARVPEVMCPFCEVETETPLHLFVDCEVVKSYWNLSLIKSKMLAAPCLSLNGKLEWLLDALVNKEEQVYLCVSLWAIWSTRNQVVWEGKVFDNLMLANWVNDFIRCYKDANHIQKVEKKREMVKWKCPPSGRLKINIDGAFDPKTKRGGLGVIVRNDEGVGIASIARSVRYASSAISMEFEACRVGLKLGGDQGWRNIELESDSILLINTLWSHQTDLSSIGDVGVDCRNLLLQIPSVKVSHVYKEANEVANRLAHIARNEDIDTMWQEESPAIIRDVLLEDLYANSCSLARGLGLSSPSVQLCNQVVLINNIGSETDPT